MYLQEGSESVFSSKTVCLTVYCGDILFSRCVFKQPQSVIYNWDQYDRFQKSVGPFVCLSICPVITLSKKAYSSFIIDSRKIIRISCERAYHPLQENEEIFSKKIFKNYRVNF